MKRLSMMVAGLVVTLVLCAEPIRISADRIQVQPMGSMIVYMLYEDPNDRVFVFPLYLQSGQTDAVDGKVYTYPGEMNETYAYWMLSDYTTHALYTEATFQKTTNGNQLHVEATATDTNGDSFELSFDADQETEGVEDVMHKNDVQKVIQNGQILIIQGDKKFTVLGNASY